MRLFLFFSSIILALSLSSPSMAQIAHPMFDKTKGTISLAGEGKVNAQPDIAYITSGVIAIAKTAQEALSQNSSSMAQLVDVLKSAGIEDRDIQSSNFNISPQYAYNNNSANNQPPKIANYRVSNNVTIIVRDIDNLGNIIDQAVSVGANSINSVSFGVDDPSDLLNEARKLAMASAIAKAQLYAKAANVSLGKIKVISESSGFMPPPFPMEMSRVAMAQDSASTPMQSGELTFRTSVSVSWELEQ